MTHTAEVMVRGAYDPDKEAHEAGNEPTLMAIDYPYGTVYLTREQAINLAIALLDRRLMAIPDVRYIVG